MIRPKFLLLWLALAAPLFAAPAPRGVDRYALILDDAPVATHIRSRAELAGPEARAAAARIAVAQRGLRDELARRSIRVTGSVQTLLNAVFVIATPQQAAALAKLPGVRGAAWMPPVKLHMDTAIDLVNARNAWQRVNGMNNAGAGVKIGIIDTGIDQTHPAFQDTSLTPPNGYPMCNSQNGDCAFTSNKVIVARSYVNLVAAGYGSDVSATSRPDDLSPRDRVGHGTAAAMMAAGVQNTAPNGHTITGVAPKAFLGNYKIFGSPGVNDTTFYDAIVAALDQAFADGMDIVTLSLGSPAIYGANDFGSACNQPQGSACDVRAEQIETAVSKGMVVVISAGNDGDYGTDKDGNPVIPTLNTIHTPGTAPHAITVGASVNAHDWFAAVNVSGLGDLAATFGDGPKPGSPTDPKPVKNVAALGNDGLACSSLPGGSLTGAIALVQRGNCPFVNKVNNAQAAGAVAVIIYREQGGQTPIPLGGLLQTTIPAVMIGFDDGTRLKTFVSQNANATAVLDPRLTAFNNPNAGQIASFSSHGPSIDTTVMKPDLVAVGTDLFTATQNYDPNGELFDQSRYTAVNGTSFSVPIVAGAAALVKQLHPGFTPAQIKSALVNTASATLRENGGTAPVTAVGGGMLDVNAAVQADVTVDPQTIAFGISPASGTSISLVTSNPGGKTLTASVVGDSSVSVSRTTSGFSVALSSGVTTPGVHQGFVQINGGNVPLRVPFLYLVGDGVPYSVYPVMGDAFDGVINDFAPTTSCGLILFKLVDQFGVPIQGAPVQFNVAQGGGQIFSGTCPAGYQGGADATTDSYGMAGANVKLGGTLGDQKFTATANAKGQSITATFLGTARTPLAINAGGIVDAASFASNQPVVPGSFIAVFGMGISDATGSSFTPYFPVSLAGVSVSFDVPSQQISLPGRLTYVSPTQVNVQVPWELQGQSTVFVKVSIGNNSSAVYTLRLTNVRPAIFEYIEPGTNKKYAAAQDVETTPYTLIGTSHPARKGHWIVVYVNGLGAMDKTPVTGEPTQSIVNATSMPTVTIGGKPATVNFAGLSTGSIALGQVNVFVPTDAPSGEQPLVVTSNTVQSQTATLLVQ